MRVTNMFKRFFVVCLPAAVLAAPLAFVAQLSAWGQERGPIHEPVYRVASVAGPAQNGPPQQRLLAQPQQSPQPAPAQPIAAPAEHPLEPALRMAREASARVKSDVRDYTATLVKRERVDGTLLPHEYMALKARQPQVVNGEQKPFAVYLEFLNPQSMKGREVIWVQGHNENKLIAHEGGWRGQITPTVMLAPDSFLAMRGNRYPITDIGIENLLLKLIEKGERDMAGGQCEVQFFEGAKINGRVCTCLQVKHPERLRHLDFHLARIFIDDELKLPIRYEAYDFPTRAGEEPQLLEEYTYLNLKLNVGLTDEDFDKNNPKYNFVRQ